MSKREQQMKGFTLLAGERQEAAEDLLLSRVEPRTCGADGQGSREWFLERMFSGTSSTLFFLLESRIPLLFGDAEEGGYDMVTTTLAENDADANHDIDGADKLLVHVTTVLEYAGNKMLFNTARELARSGLAPPPPQAQAVAAGSAPSNVQASAPTATANAASNRLAATADAPSFQSTRDGSHRTPQEEAKEWVAKLSNPNLDLDGSFRAQLRDLLIGPAVQC